MITDILLTLLDHRRPKSTYSDRSVLVNFGRCRMWGGAYHVVPAQVDIEINKGVSAMFNSRLNVNNINNIVIQCLCDKFNKLYAI